MDDEPYEDSINYINKLHENYNIIFITARKLFPEYEKSTEDWLYKHNYNYDSIIYTTSSSDKIQYINSAKKHLFIDDLKIKWEISPIDDNNMITLLQQNNVNYFQFNGNWADVVINI